jgi:hypothetical protein
VQLGWRVGTNGSRRWAGAERGDVMKKKSRLAAGREFRPKELREYRK